MYVARIESEERKCDYINYSVFSWKTHTIVLFLLICIYLISCLLHFLFSWHLSIHKTEHDIDYSSGLDYFPPFVTLQLEYSNMWNGITNCRGGTLRRGQCDNNEVTKQASQNIENSCEIARWSETCDFVQKKAILVFVLLRRYLIVI